MSSLIASHWSDFAIADPAIADAWLRLVENEEVAYLATVSAGARPRIHPFVPRIVNGRLAAFVLDTSPKCGDLRRSGAYAIHTTQAPEDEEVYLSGTVNEVDDDVEFRAATDIAMGFATGPADRHHILFEFLIERALWTRWLDFGTPDHRPERRLWTS